MNQPGEHPLKEALEGQVPTPIAETHAGGPSQPKDQGQPGAMPQQTAEDTRREHESRSDGRVDREDRLVNMGRGQQTHG